MSWTDKVLALHPLVVTVALLLVFGLGAGATNLFPFGSREYFALNGITTALAVVPLMVWQLSLFTAARSVAAYEGRRRMPLVFVVLAAAVILYLLLYLFTLGVGSLASPAREALGSVFLVITVAVMVVLVLSYFVAIWTASTSLQRLEESRPSTGSVILTFLLIFYLPIGIWFLRPRIRRMLALPTSSGA